MAAPEQPKKPAGGAFGRFMAEKRPEFQKRCVGQPCSAVQKLGGEEWKKLSDAEKRPYQQLFEVAQKKFKEDMDAFLAAGGEKKKGATALRSEKRKAKELKVAKKDANKPKKPAGGAYGVFLAQNREAFQKERPGSVAGVAKLAGEKWKALSEAEKAPYEKEYQQKLAAYKEAMQSYTPPAGISAEAEDEDDAGDDDEADEAEEDAKETPQKKAKKTADADVEEEKPSKGRGGGRGRGRGAAKAGEVKSGIAISESVQSKAHAKGYTELLTKLLGREDIQAHGVSASKALEALESSNGLLHQARRALLGA